MKKILRDIADITLGYPLRGSPENLPSGTIPFVQLKNVSMSNDIDWKNVLSVTLPSIHEQAWLKHGDIIFSARGLRAFAYPIINPPVNVVCAPHFFVIRIQNTSIVLPEFLAWQINQKPAQNYFQQTKTGAVTPTIRRDDLEKLEIMLPPLEKQKCIVKFWKAVQEEQKLLIQMIKNRNSQIEALIFSLVKQKSQET